MCGPNGDAAAHANAEALRVVDDAACTIRAASGRVGWFSAIAEATQPRPNDAARLWHDYDRTMGPAPVVARTAQTAVACACLVVELAQTLMGHVKARTRETKFTNGGPR